MGSVGVGGFEHQKAYPSIGAGILYLQA